MVSLGSRGELARPGSAQTLCHTHCLACKPCAPNSRSSDVITPLAGCGKRCQGCPHCHGSQCHHEHAPAREVLGEPAAAHTSLSDPRSSPGSSGPPTGSRGVQQQQRSPQPLYAPADLPRNPDAGRVLHCGPRSPQGLATVAPLRAHQGSPASSPARTTAAAAP